MHDRLAELELQVVEHGGPLQDLQSLRHDLGTDPVTGGTYIDTAVAKHEV